MLEIGFRFNVVVCLVRECLWLVQVQRSAAWVLLICGASWVRGSPVAPLACSERPCHSSAQHMR